MLLAIALPLLCVTSQGTATRQAFPGLPVIKVYRVAFESRPWSATMDGFEGRVTDVKLGEISVMDAPGSKPRFLATGETPVLSPNGQRVAFCGPDESGRYHSRIMNFDGSGSPQLVATNRDACPSAWLAYGEKLAFTDFGGKTHMVAIADADGGNYRTITEGFYPQWSPDGKQLVYYRDFDSKKNRIAIWIVGADGTGARKVIDEDTPPAPSASWNSFGPPRFFQGTQIIFSSDRSHTWCIYRVNLDGTGLEKIAEDGQFDLFHPVLSPDGGQLVVQGDSRPVGSTEKAEKVVLLLELSSMKWTRLANGTSPSALWESTSPLQKMVLQEGQAQPMPSTDNSLIAQGRSRYLYYKCGDCHGPNGEGGGDGPDLTGTRLTAAEISKFLEKPSPDAYMKGMPDIPTTSPDHQALVAYVISLKLPPEPAARPAQSLSSREEPQKNDSPAHHKLSAAEKAHILDGEFTIEKQVDRLPDSLKSAFEVLAKQNGFAMANPGEKYQETDVISELGLPSRRLIFAGISKDRYFIHYEKGGIFHSYHLAVFDVSPTGKVTFHWGGAGGPAANDLAQLRKMVSAGAFADDLAYYW
jgi:Tol biopolymer transport system component